MKPRGFLSAATAFMILTAGCSDTPGPDPGALYSRAIEFTAPTLNSLTRNAPPAFPYDRFRVYCFVDNAEHTLYDGTEVERGPSGKWTCGQQEYWHPGHTYWFSAIAPADAKGITFDTATGAPPYAGGGTLRYRAASTGAGTDLLYAFREETTPASIEGKAPAVDLEFNHLLSQVTFTFVNELDNPHFFINVPSIVLGNLPSEGSIDLDSEHPAWRRSGSDSFWAGTDGVYIIKGGRPKTSGALYLLPMNMRGCTIQLQTHLFFTYDPESEEGMEFSGVKTFTVDFPDITLRPGHSYNLTAHLDRHNVDGPDDGLVPISFEIHDTSWRYPYFIDVDTM